MNTAQRERLLAVVERDAAIRYRYVDEEGRNCIIGGLLAEVGVDVRKFLGSAINSLGMLCQEHAQDRVKLMKGFGLLQSDVNVLQRKNDTHDHRGDRQQSLRKYINTLPVREE